MRNSLLNIKREKTKEIIYCFDCNEPITEIDLCSYNCVSDNVELKKRKIIKRKWKVTEECIEEEVIIYANP